MRYNKYWRAISGCQQTVSSLRKSLFRVFGLGEKSLHPEESSQNTVFMRVKALKLVARLKLVRLLREKWPARGETGTLAKTGALGYN